MPTYKILLSQSSHGRAQTYLGALKAGQPAGRYLQQALAGLDLASLTIETFLERLVQTKRPQIFAESAVAGDGSDWNLTELGLLGDISVATPLLFLTMAVTPIQMFTIRHSRVGCCLYRERCYVTAAPTRPPIGKKLLRLMAALMRMPIFGCMSGDCCQGFYTSTNRCDCKGSNR